MSRSNLEEFASWGREFSESVARLVPDRGSSGFHLDPDIVSILPYQAEGTPGEPCVLEVEVRNPLDAALSASVRLVLPDGWGADPDPGYARVDPGDSARIRFSVLAPRNATRGVRHVTLADVALGPRRLGLAAESLIVLR